MSRFYELSADAIEAHLLRSLPIKGCRCHFCEPDRPANVSGLRRQRRKRGRYFTMAGATRALVNRLAAERDARLAATPPAPSNSEER